jgi:alcohol dehydrogenase class IV
MMEGMGEQLRIQDALAGRVVLGAGARHAIPAEIERLGAERVFLVATHSAATAAAELAGALGGRLAARFDRPVVHTPVKVTQEALALLSGASADLVVALGGGSAIGLGKALSVRTGLPQLAVPTTYAGSEVTPVLGETEDGVKTTRRDPAIAPGTVVYDPELTLAMPAGLTLTSSLNALAHAVEALWAPDATMATDALATEAADGILNTLPAVLADPSRPAARARLQEAAWLAGICLARTKMGLHHQLAHVLGGGYDLPHAELHSLLLAHVTAYNLPYAPAAAERLGRIVGADPVRAIASLARSYEGPKTLGELGVPREALPELAARVLAKPYPNPRPPALGPLTELLEAAWE